MTPTFFNKVAFEHFKYSEFNPHNLRKCILREYIEDLKADKEQIVREWRENKTADEVIEGSDQPRGSIIIFSQ